MTIERIFTLDTDSVAEFDDQNQLFINVAQGVVRLDFSPQEQALLRNLLNDPSAWAARIGEDCHVQWLLARQQLLLSTSEQAVSLSLVVVERLRDLLNQMAAAEQAAGQADEPGDEPSGCANFLMVNHNGPSGGGHA
jgi:hypothetical protein